MKKRWMLWILVSLMSVTAMLSGCNSLKQEEQTIYKSNENVYETLEELEDEFVVFCDPAAGPLMQSFVENHPEIKIKRIVFNYWDGTEDDPGAVLRETIKKYGPPDLILGKLHQFEYDWEDLPGCYEKGYIVDMDSYCAEDPTLDQTKYFPGTFDIFRDENHLYALPLGISVDFMLTTDSKYDNSSFSNLEVGYTGAELVEVLHTEVEKNEGSGKLFCTEFVDGMKLLNQLGGISQTEEGIQVDEELFQKVYEFAYMNDEQWIKAKDARVENDVQYTNSNGFVEQPAFEPRMYENQFVLNFWYDMDAAALAMSYATTANLYHIEEGTKAIYIPNKDDGNSFKANVKVYGAIGAESTRKELAYEVLRLIMDEPITYFDIIEDSNRGWFDMGNSYNLYPINRENALGLLEEFENRNALLFYGQPGTSGGFLQKLDRVDVSDEEKEKHENMLNGIDGLYYWDEKIAVADEIMNNYHSVEITDYKACYNEIVEALNSAYSKNNE